MNAYLPASVLVDTSVFIDFFRRGESEPFSSLVLENRVILSSLVRLELLQGVRQSEVGRLEFVLGGLQHLSLEDRDCEVAEEFLTKLKGRGLTLGIVDLLLSAQAARIGAPIYSLDRIFEKLAGAGLIRSWRG